MADVEQDVETLIRGRARVTGNFVLQSLGFVYIQAPRLGGLGCFDGLKRLSEASKTIRLLFFVPDYVSFAWQRTNKPKLFMGSQTDCCAGALLISNRGGLWGWPHPSIVAISM